MHQAVHPHDGPGPMDRPRQSDSFAGYMEGQIIGIACGPVGAPLYNHERRGWTQQQQQYNEDKQYEWITIYPYSHMLTYIFVLLIPY